MDVDLSEQIFSPSFSSLQKKKELKLSYHYRYLFYYCHLSVRIPISSLFTTCRVKFCLFIYKSQSFECLLFGGCFWFVGWVQFFCFEVGWDFSGGGVFLSFASCCCCCVVFWGFFCVLFAEQSYQGLFRLIYKITQIICLDRQYHCQSYRNIF